MRNPATWLIYVLLATASNLSMGIGAPSGLPSLWSTIAGAFIGWLANFRGQNLQAYTDDSGHVWTTDATGFSMTTGSIRVTTSAQMALPST